jgi:hypothetical protein
MTGKACDETATLEMVAVVPERARHARAFALLNMDYRNQEVAGAA